MTRAARRAQPSQKQNGRARVAGLMAGRIENVQVERSAFRRLEYARRRTGKFGSGALSQSRRKTGDGLAAEERRYRRPPCST